VCDPRGESSLCGGAPEREKGREPGTHLEHIRASWLGSGNMQASCTGSTDHDPGRTRQGGVKKKGGTIRKRGGEKGDANVIMSFIAKPKFQNQQKSRSALSSRKP